MGWAAGTNQPAVQCSALLPYRSMKHDYYLYSTNPIAAHDRGCHVRWHRPLGWGGRWADCGFQDRGESRSPGAPPPQGIPGGWRPARQLGWRLPGCVCVSQTLPWVPRMAATLADDSCCHKRKRCMAAAARLAWAGRTARPLTHSAHERTHDAPLWGEEAPRALQRPQHRECAETACSDGAIEPKGDG